MKKKIISFIKRKKETIANWYNNNLLAISMFSLIATFLGTMVIITGVATVAYNFLKEDKIQEIRLYVSSDFYLATRTEGTGTDLLLHIMSTSNKREETGLYTIRFCNGDRCTDKYNMLTNINTEYGTTRIGSLQIDDKLPEGITFK